MLTPGLETCKGKTRTHIRAVLTAAVALTVGACGSVQVESQSFRVNHDSSVESAQIATDADFSKYDRLQATELGIYFPQSHRTTADDLRRIREIFRSAFLSELEPFTIVEQPGPTTMTVEASLVDLRNSDSSQIPQLRTQLRDLAKPGSILFLMEMRDSESGRVLARAADSAKAPTFATGDGIETDWGSIEDAAQHWAALFRIFLDENLAR